MYSKFLFVGLGGSGGKTLRFLKREILNWMREHDAGSQIPRAWQFLHIDTPTVADGDEINDVADRLSADEYLGLIESGMEFRALQNVLDGNKTVWPELRTWRVEPAGLGVTVQYGAGQFRAVGQTVAMAYSLRIREELEERVRRITGSRAATDLGELFSRITGKPAGATSNTHIIVVSSLAGGTGAGLLNLVCDILRGIDTPAAGNVFAILYTPEVFQSVGGAKLGGVHPNSLAAICEMLNGQWWQGSDTSTPAIAGPKKSPVLEQAGLPFLQERSGPTYPFLVGRVGAGGIDHGTPDRLFEMAGRSLLSWVSDAEVQGTFLAYTAGNWASSALNQRQGEILVNEGEPNERGMPCFSALGFARLSVGTEHLERYACQRLAKSALTRLTRYHSESPEAESVRGELDSDDPDAVLRQLATNHLPSFLRQARLTEVGPEDNEIQDELRPLEESELRAEFDREARYLCGLDVKGQHDTEHWRSRISEAIDQAQQHYERSYREKLEASTQTWIPAVSERLAETVERWIASHGLLVTAEMCRMASSYLERDVYDDLMNIDVAERQHWARTWQTPVNEALEGIRGRVANTDDRLAHALRQGVDSASWAGDALISERAAQLVREVADRVVKPLEDALRRGHASAREDASRVVSWVEGNESPPDSLRPPAGDFSLIDPDDFPAIFQELVERDVGSSERSLEQLETLVQQLISGSFRRGAASGGDPEELRCVQIRQDWWPSTSTSIGGSHASTPLRVKIAISIDELEARTRAWLRRPGSAWERQLSTTIRTFVGTGDELSAPEFDEVQAGRNRARLINQLGAAVDAAAPLINLDENLLGLVHPNSVQDTPLVHLSAVPLASHPIEAELRARLGASGIGDSAVDEILNSDASITHVDITTSLAAPVSVLVAESLLRPIAERWYQCDTPQLRADFWSRRRAKPLDEFVPVPQALLRCMTRGWYTGRMLGRIAPVGESYAIFSTRRRGPVNFLPHFLSGSRLSGEQDAVALVLEALALAYVEICRAGTLDSLVPYIELRDLGRSVSDGALYSYGDLAPVLSDWVQSGSTDNVVDADGALVNRHDSGHDTSTAAGRLEHLIAICRETLEYYEDNFRRYLRDFEVDQHKLSTAPHWTGLWERHMSPALNDLIEAAEVQLEAHTSGASSPLM